MGIVTTVLTYLTTIDSADLARIPRPVPKRKSGYRHGVCTPDFENEMNRVKVKVRLSLCLIKHHAVKMYGYCVEDSGRHHASATLSQGIHPLD